MDSTLSLGLDLSLAIFTLLYLSRLLFCAWNDRFDRIDTSTHQEKRSLLNQHISPRAVIAKS